MSSKIKDGFFIGEAEGALDYDFLETNQIQYIVNCTAHQVENAFELDGIQYLSYEMDQIPQEFVFDLDGRMLNEIIDFIDRALDRCSAVMIHCTDGYSISPCVSMAYIMNKYSWGVDKSYEFMLQKRPDIQLQQEYIDQLYALEQQIVDRTGDSEKAVRRRNEWQLDAADTSTDEPLLINTYINSKCTGAITQQEMEKFQTSQGSRCSHQRRLSWIDSQPYNRPAVARKLLCPERKILRPERPPNTSYSSLEPGNGWIDVTNPVKSQYSKYSDEKKTLFEHRSILRETDLNYPDSCSHENRLDEVDDSWDLSTSDASTSADLYYDKKSSRPEVVETQGWVDQSDVSSASAFILNGMESELSRPRRRRSKRMDEVELNLEISNSFSQASKKQPSDQSTPLYLRQTASSSSRASKTHRRIDSTRRPRSATSQRIPSPSLSNGRTTPEFVGQRTRPRSSCGSRESFSNMSIASKKPSTHRGKRRPLSATSVRTNEQPTRMAAEKMFDIDSLSRAAGKEYRYLQSTISSKRSDRGNNIRRTRTQSLRQHQRWR